MSCSNERMAGVGANRIRINTRKYVNLEGSTSVTRSASRGVSVDMLGEGGFLRRDGKEIRKANRHSRIKESFL